MTAKAIPLFILLAVISHPVMGLEDESPEEQPSWGIVPFPIISYTPETELKSPQNSGNFPLSTQNMPGDWD